MIFNHPKSTKEEKELLLRFSLFRTEIDREGVFSLFDGEDVSSTLYKLIDKKMYCFIKKYSHKALHFFLNY